jgi:hypothetical protein
MFGRKKSCRLSGRLVLWCRRFTPINRTGRRQQVERRL